MPSLMPQTVSFYLSLFCSYKEFCAKICKYLKNRYIENEAELTLVLHDLPCCKGGVESIS